MRAVRFAFGVVAFMALVGGPAASAQSISFPPVAFAQQSQDAAAAQAGAKTPDKAPAGADRKWEFEVHGGVSSTSDQINGSGNMPATGTILQGLLSASTFYFGEGARLFNQNQAAVLGSQAGSTIVPLDSIVVGSAIRRERGATAGLRIERALNRRLAIEVAGDYGVDRLAFTPESLSALDATRQSFISALARTFSSFPVASSVTSVATVNDHQLAVQMFTTGTLVVNLRETGRTIPYVAAGGGIAFRGGNTPSATLVGNYQLGSPAQLLGTDTVKLSYTEKAWAPVVVGGGGARHLITSRWGIRIDARAQFYRNSTANLVDATPQTLFRSTNQPFPVINAGALEFATTAPLNGAPLAGATTFNGSGVQAHLVFSAGFFGRF